MIRQPPSSPLFPYTTLFRSLPPLRKTVDRPVLERRAVSRFLLVVLVLAATAGVVVAYGDPEQIARASTTVSDMLRQRAAQPARDRKSTRLNSSHANISYAVF